jgi:hypothetical protein
MGQFRTVYASIDNTADALGQDAWTVYHRKFVALVRHHAMDIHAELVSPFGARIQRAAVRFEIADGDVKLLQHDLVTLAGEYGRDGIDWDHAKPKRLVPSTA